MLGAIVIGAAVLAAGSQDEPTGREDARTLLLRVVEHQEANQERQADYVYLETVTTESLAKDGSVEKTESETFEVIPTAGGEYRRLVARNGRPLSPKEAAEEEKKLRRHLERVATLSEEERVRAAQKRKTRAGRFETRLRQALEVHEFTPLPDDVVDGRPVRVFSFRPRPDYRPHNRATKVLHKLEGTIWVDPVEAQIVRLHVRFRDDLKILGGLFGRIRRGTEATAEQQWIGGRDWMLETVRVELYGRLYFVKPYRRRITYTYGDYRRFTVETEETLRLPAAVRR